MRLQLVVLLTALGALAVQAPLAVAAPAASPATKLCGQIKNGPYDAWSGYLKSGKTVKLTGKTWTVTAVPGSLCSVAMKATPVLLKQWASHSLLKLNKGWLCGSVPGSGPTQSRGGSCQALPSLTRRFSFTMFGQLTIGQIKQEFGIK